MVNMSVGQRWFLNTSCHKFIIQIDKLTNDTGVGWGKVVQVFYRAPECGLNLSVGSSDFVAHNDHAEWEFLPGQEEPTRL
jgi:hypothetical protein